MTYCSLPGFYITYAALTPGNAILLPFFLNPSPVCWDMGGRDRAAEEGGLAHPPTRANFGAERRTFNNISKQCRSVCGRLHASACSLKSQKVCGVHLCSTLVPPASLLINQIQI
ncbi:hypothetical protein ILYODFUR_027817 [Ilyodon furcidens]|uniref:Uncharacterized protein n=1 Tax=Ilyodon furcidens TaxID=33524 RepID=A0ABV0UX31_9TELE